MSISADICQLVLSSYTIVRLTKGFAMSSYMIVRLSKTSLIDFISLCVRLYTIYS